MFVLKQFASISILRNQKATNETYFTSRSTICARTTQTANFQAQARRFIRSGRPIIIAHIYVLPHYHNLLKSWHGKYLYLYLYLYLYSAGPVTALNAPERESV